MTGKTQTLYKLNETPLQQKIFKEGIKELKVAFNLKEFSPDRAKLYFRKLCEISSDESFTKAVENIISGERYFPTIACFRDYLGENGGQKNKDHEKYRQTELAKSRVGAHCPATEPQKEITLEEYTADMTEMIREMTDDPEATWEPPDHIKKYYANRNDSKKQ